MKLAVVVSRNFDNYQLLERELYTLCYIAYNIEYLISGSTEGVDLLAEKFSNEHTMPIKVFKPDWDKYGKSAEFKRNQQIVDACDMVLVFWDGKSKRTQDVINKAKKAKKPTFIIYF